MTCAICNTEIESGVICGHCECDEINQRRRMALAAPEGSAGDLFSVLVAIVNTAQNCPDRCMADVCNDNFLAHGIPLRAEFVGGNWPIKITPNH